MTLIRMTPDRVRQVGERGLNGAARAVRSTPYVVDELAQGGRTTVANRDRIAAALEGAS